VFYQTLRRYYVSIRAKQSQLRGCSLSHDAAGLVFCADNAAVREIPNDHAHSRVFISGEFEALKPGEVLEVFWVGHGTPDV
jgi:hypothetical protein